MKNKTKRTPFGVLFVGGEGEIHLAAQVRRCTVATKAFAFVRLIGSLGVSQFELEMYNADSDGVHPSEEFLERYTAPKIAEFIRQSYKV